MSDLHPSERSILRGDAGTVICFCERITELEIQTAIVVGQATTVEEVSLKTRAGTACRGCHCRINRMLQGKPAQCPGPCGWCAACGCISALCSCGKC
jgi:bacterioferritin-associated ferredoxin